MRMIFILLCLVLVGCECKLEPGQYNSLGEKTAYQKGQRAAAMGIPATANPNKYHSEATAWLDGYMDYKSTHPDPQTETSHERSD